MKFEDLMKLPEIDKYTISPEDGDYDDHIHKAMKAVFDYMSRLVKVRESEISVLKLNDHSLYNKRVNNLLEKWKKEDKGSEVE